MRASASNVSYGRTNHRRPTHVQVCCAASGSGLRGLAPPLRIQPAQAPNTRRCSSSGFRRPSTPSPRSDKRHSGTVRSVAGCSRSLRNLSHKRPSVAGQDSGNRHPSTHCHFMAPGVITLARAAVIFILFYRRGALEASGCHRVQARLVNSPANRRWVLLLAAAEAGERNPSPASLRINSRPHRGGAPVGAFAAVATPLLRRHHWGRRPTSPSCRRSSGPAAIDRQAEGHIHLDGNGPSPCQLSSAIASLTATPLAQC